MNVTVIRCQCGAQYSTTSSSWILFSCTCGQSWETRLATYGNNAVTVNETPDPILPGHWDETTRWRDIVND